MTVAAEIQAFSIWESNGNGAGCASFYLFASQDSIAFSQQSSAAIWRNSKNLTNDCFDGSGYTVHPRSPSFLRVIPVPRKY
ncbi:hypothetical protein [Kluyvera sichuanensis]|uniref:hypothetical protein n=1 Tax=Kluyvera sichuanensis TaxID=2725494 RepID=UPI0021DF6E7A|nr:hypothetical protein [Kluyvera sichuanensis]